MEGLAGASDKDATTASSGNESETDVEKYMSNQAQKKSQSSHLYPKLIDTIALIYMAIMMLRRPLGQATMLK